MTLRRRLGLALTAVYVGTLVYATAATQCPVRSTAEAAPAGRPGGGITCAMVHALVHAARPPAAASAIVAVPMRASTGQDGDPLVLAAATR